MIGRELVHYNDPAANFVAEQQRYHFAPKGDTPHHQEDILVVVGTQDKLDEIRGRS